MSDFNLTAPSMPYQKKKESGLFKRLFKRDSSEQQPEPPAPQPQIVAPVQHEEVDLEEIKRKLGLDDELPPLQTAVAPPEPGQWAAESVPEAPQQEPPARVTVDDWTAEGAKNAAASASPWASPVDMRHEELPASDGTDEKLQPLPRDHELAPLHHEVVEQHLASIGKSAARVDDALKKSAPAPEVPEWKLQDKEIPPNSYFILRNGQPVRSLRELIEAFDYIDESTFDHHVNEYRNDFANWIRDVIHDPELAAEVQQAKDKQGMRDTLFAHHSDALKRVTKEQEKLNTIVKKREEALQKLGTVEDQIATLRKQLGQKSQELLGERKRAAKLIKDKLDEEIKRRLIVEKNSLTAARAQLAKAKQEQLAKAKEYETLTKGLTEREKELLLNEQKAAELMKSAEEAHTRLAEEKRNASALIKDAEVLKKQFEEMKKLDLQSKKALETIARKEADMARREGTASAREKKITADLTRIQSEQEKLAKLKEEHAKREAAAKRMEADAQKIMADAESRATAALDQERDTAERMKADMKKLETLRKTIDAKLGKALGQKKKITDAIALRKELEKAITTTKQEVKKERDEMKAESYKALIEAKIETTPVGQPDSAEEEATALGDKQLPIYQKISECRMALERKDVHAARVLYNELREEFQQVKVDTAERSALYTSIRELYDDIHLMMLG